MLEAKIIEKMLVHALPVSVYNELESTNLTARELAVSGDACEQVILARAQSKGRGRLGRNFFSPSGGLYMSLLLRPRLHASKALYITTAAAVAVARAIDAVSDTRAEIKWVNDIYLCGRKVCGILTESQIGKNGMLDYAVLGIGVNLTPPQGGFPPDISMRAGAVFDTLVEGADNALAASIINEFWRLYECEDTAECLNEYRERSNLIGREVDVIRIVGDKATPARVLGIDEDFSLIVEFENGKKEALASGEVSVRAHE